MEAYSELFQTSKIELSARVVSDWKLISIFVVLIQAFKTVYSIKF